MDSPAFLVLTHVDDSIDSITTYRFEEEAIGLPALTGFGYAEINIGNELGPQGRYTGCPQTWLWDIFDRLAVRG